MAAIAYRLRTALRRQPALLALIGAVAIGAVLILTITAGAIRTLTAPNRYEQLRPGHHVLVEQADGPPRTEEIAVLPAVKSIDAATFVFGALMQEGKEQPAGALVFAGSAEAFGERTVAGRQPNPAEPGEFFATQSFVEQTGAQLGDRFQLITVSAEQAAASGFDVDRPAGPTIPATLVGYGDGPAELQDGYQVVAFPATLLDQGDIGTSASNSSIELRPGAGADDLRAQLASLPGETEFGISDAELVPASVRTSVNAQGQGLAVVALIVTVAVIAVIGQLLGRQVRLGDEQRLTLGAIGMTRNQVAADQLSAAAVPALVGTAVGTGIAIVLSGTFPISFARHVEPAPGWRFDPLAHVIAPLLLAVLLLGWVWLSLVVGSRVPRPRRAARGLDAITSRLRPPPAAIGAQYAFAPQRRGLSAASLIGLAIVTGIMVGATIFGASVGRVIDQPHRYGASDLAIGQGGDEIAPDVITALADDPDVASITRYGTILATADGKTIDVVGGAALKGHPRVKVLSGQMVRHDDEIALGRIEARNLGADVGDEIHVAGSGEPIAMRVTGIAVIPGIEGADGLGHGGLVTYEGLTRLSPDVASGSATVELRPGASANTRQRLGELIGMEVGSLDPPPDIISLTRIRMIPWIVAGALGLLVVLGLAHLLILSGHHRRRDVAVLRGLGASRRWVTSVFHWQASLAAIAMAVIATPLGVLAGRALYRAFIGRIGVEDDLSVPYLLLGLCLVGLLVLANAAAVLPARRVCRRSPARFLHTE